MPSAFMHVPVHRCPDFNRSRRVATEPHDRDKVLSRAVFLIARGESLNDRNGVAPREKRTNRRAPCCTLQIRARRPADA